MIRAMTLLLMLAITAPLTSTATASPWSLSVSGGRGVLFVRYSKPNPRAGIQADIFHSASKLVELGLQGSWWEELGVQGFSYAPDFSNNQPDDEHQRVFATAALVRLHLLTSYGWPYLVAGAGEYATVHRYRYSDHRPTSSVEYAPGLSAGIGVSGSGRPSPLFEARWHRIFANTDPYDSTLKTTDLLLVSVGFNFN